MQPPTLGFWNLNNLAKMAEVFGSEDRHILFIALLNFPLKKIENREVCSKEGTGYK